MPLFCRICNNLLIVSTTADSFHFKCVKCEHIEEHTEADTLRYEEENGTNFTIFGSILRNAGLDPVNPKVAKQCKCGNKTARQVRLGSEMRLINTCIKCGEQWLDGTRENENEFGAGEVVDDDKPDDVVNKKVVGKKSKSGKKVKVSKK